MNITCSIRETLQYDVRRNIEYGVADQLAVR